MNKTELTKVLAKLDSHYLQVEQDKDEENIMLTSSGLGIFIKKTDIWEDLIRMGAMDFLGRLNDKLMNMQLISELRQYGVKNCSISKFIYDVGYMMYGFAVDDEGNVYAYPHHFLKLVMSEDAYYRVNEEGRLIVLVEYPKETGREPKIAIRPVEVKDEQDRLMIERAFNARLLPIASEGE